VIADVPVLLISGSLDLRTPPATAEEVLPGLTRGRHLVIEGAAHDDLFLSSPKLATAMMRFLETGDPGIERIRLRPLRFKLP
jgi:pimeloyl-ACP methyl ester carboxylesterase